MAMLHYEIFSQTIEAGDGANGRLIDLIASGTLTLTSTRSAAIAIPRGGRPYTNWNSIVGVFKVLSSASTDRSYVEIRADNSSSTQGAASVTFDAAPRSLVGADDGAVLFTLPPGGTFTAVLASAVG